MVKKMSILLGFCSIAITPWWTYDPINPIKYVLLCIAGCISLIQLWTKKDHLKNIKILIIAVAIFVLQLLGSLIFSGANITSGIFGAYGRLFGASTLLMLFAIFLFYSISPPQKELLRVFTFVGIVSLLYSIMQLFRIDFAPWKNDYDPVIGFLGNPNFQSSFLGLFFLALIGRIVERNNSLWLQAVWGLLAAIDLTVIYKTRSIQGLFVVLVGILTIFIYYLFYKKQFLSVVVLFLTSAFGAVLFVLAVLGIGPLQNYLHKGTLAIRGDYWRAAISMSLNNPLTGVGPDSYGENYRLFRPIESLTRVNSDVTSDSAHNGFLDFAANLGILSLVIYLLILIFIFIKAIKYIQATSLLNISHMISTAIWVSFNAQMLISPNQIGLTVWGWAFAGLMLSYSNKMIPAGNSTNIGPMGKKNDLMAKPVGGSQMDFFSVLFGALMGLVMSLPIFISNAQFKSSLESADAVKVIAASHSWPRDPAVILMTARLLFANNLMEQGLEEVNFGIQEFPNSFELWRIKLQYNRLSTNEIALIKSKLSYLDPLNTNL